MAFKINSSDHNPINQRFFFLNLYIYIYMIFTFLFSALLAFLLQQQALYRNGSSGTALKQELCLIFSFLGMPYSQKMQFKYLEPILLLEPFHLRNFQTQEAAHLLPRRKTPGQLLFFFCLLNNIHSWLAHIAPYSSSKSVGSTSLVVSNQVLNQVLNSTLEAHHMILTIEIAHTVQLWQRAGVSNTDYKGRCHAVGVSLSAAPC